jgi:hypothetical protein
VAFRSGEKMRPRYRDSDSGLEVRVGIMAKKIFKITAEISPKIPLFSPKIFDVLTKHSKLNPL